VAEITEVKTPEHLTAAEAEQEGDRLLADSQQQQALECFQHALKSYQKEGKKKEEATIYLKIGNLYNSFKDTENALLNLMEGLNLVTLLNDRKEIIKFNIRIGSFYQAIYQFANAYEYYNEGLKKANQLKDIALIQECHYSIGNCLNWMERLDEAFSELDKALVLDEDNKGIRKRVLGSTGILLYKMKDYHKSLTYFTEALDLNSKTDNDISFRANILKSMGYVYYMVDNVNDAIKCLDEALTIAERLQQPTTSAVIHEHYSTIYELSGDYKKALDHLKKNKFFEGILVNENIKVKTRELQKKFDIAESQKEKEIYRLKNVDLAQANDEISRQKIELEEKNRSITDSIFYAGRLQKAILPPENLLNKYFAEAFIFFQPKDIVSGDFYWFSGKNEQFVLAAVDCTGHGVPGALMSMMGNNFLSSIVETESKTNPAEILQQMNKRTKTSLQNKEASVTANDGMDLALCSIDFKNQTLYYSGAYRPLVFIRDGQLNEIKGDKHSIGGISEFDTTFTLHQLNIQKGDTFYIYSDGYADQFGGHKNRKYMAGKLKDFLVEISARPMNEQQQLLTENHYNWRGENEQVDDLLVIGFRF
jgi:serine phosphatase RsbU (regulator of sigma subunit)